MKPRPAEPAEDRIFPTAERFQHDQITYGEETIFSELGGRSTSKAITHRVRTQRIIDRLVMHETITEKQHAAAARLWRVIHAAGMVGHAKVNLVGIAVSGLGTPWSAGGPERAASAREEAKAALEAVPARLRPVLRWVVVDDLALRYLAARRGGDTSRALGAVKAELGEALDALVRFWRL